MAMGVTGPASLYHSGLMVGVISGWWGGRFLCAGISGWLRGKSWVSAFGESG